jgi:hypothetical protein
MTEPATLRSSGVRCALNIFYIPFDVGAHEGSELPEGPVLKARLEISALFLSYIKPLF